MGSSNRPYYGGHVNKRQAHAFQKLHANPSDDRRENARHPCRSAGVISECDSRAAVAN